MSRGRWTTDAQRYRISELALLGYPLADIADAVGLSQACVSDWIEKLGVWDQWRAKCKVKGRKVCTRKQIDMIKSMALDGKGIREIAEVIGKTKNCVWAQINKIGVFDEWKAKRSLVTKSGRPRKRAKYVAPPTVVALPKIEFCAWQDYTCTVGSDRLLERLQAGLR